MCGVETDLVTFYEVDEEEMLSKKVQMSIYIFNPFISSNDVYKDLIGIGWRRSKRRWRLLRECLVPKPTLKKLLEFYLSSSGGLHPQPQPQVCLALARRLVPMMTRC